MPMQMMMPTKGTVFDPVTGQYVENLALQPQMVQAYAPSSRVVPVDTRGHAILDSNQVPIETSVPNPNFAAEHPGMMFPEETNTK